MQNLSVAEYNQFCVFLQEACGINLGENKHYLVNSRLNKILRELEIDTVGELLHIVAHQQKNQLRERVIDAMTTNETFWFRDNYPFEALKQLILPELAQKGSQPLRIWSAACSTGQEPYSISITVEEFSSGRFFPNDVQIFSTDISPSSLELAKRARYDEKTLARGMSEERKKRFFTRAGDQWELNERIKSRVQFRLVNLLNNYTVLGRFDVIFCRNVLIYFSSELKRNIIKRMIMTLNPRGHLFLGSSETVTGLSAELELVKSQYGVFYRAAK